MNEKSSYLGMVFRAVIFVIAPLAVMLALPAAIALWPDSESVRTWEITYGVLLLLSFVAFFAIRSWKK